MNAGDDEKATWHEPVKPVAFVGLLRISVVLGVLIALVTSVLSSIDLGIFGSLRDFTMPTFRAWGGFALWELAVSLTALCVLAAIPGAVMGVCIAALLYVLARLRLPKGRVGVVAGIIVALPISAMFFFVSIGLAAMDYVPDVFEKAALLRVYP